MYKDIENKFVKNSGFLQSSDISTRTDWRMLRKMIDNKKVTKVKRGLYKLNDSNIDTQMIEVAKSFPFAVFGLFSAWRYYELSTYIPFAFHIVIPHNKYIKLPDYPPLRVYYLTEKAYKLGIKEIDMSGSKIKIYDLEKSVCDAIRFRNKVGIDTTIEVLKNYVKRKDRDLNLLSKYAQQLRIENIMQTMIMPLL